MPDTQKTFPIDPRIMVALHDSVKEPCVDLVLKSEGVWIETHGLIVYLSKLPGMTLLIEVYENEQAVADENCLFSTNVYDPKDLEGDNHA